MKCCSVSITLLHVLTAVSAVMMIAASSYALDTEHWMKNTSLQTKDHDVSTLRMRKFTPHVMPLSTRIYDCREQKPTKA